MPVRFECMSCDEAWWAPPGNGCPRCGEQAEAIPDPVVWTVGEVPGTNVSISGQLLERGRFHRIVGAGITVFVDVAGAHAYVWRPTAEDIRAAGVSYVRIEGVEDTNRDLPDRAFDELLAALDSAEECSVLLFCAAGLKRSPHLMYGVLRRRGHDRADAWGRIAAARPFTDPFEPYIDAAERWASLAVERE
jgi:hypothetical protein